MKTKGQYKFFLNKEKNKKKINNIFFTSIVLTINL